MISIRSMNFSRNQLTAMYGAGALSIGYGLLFAPPQSTRKKIAIVGGVGAIAFAAIRWRVMDIELANITRNPEVMNGHFLTAGGASAVTGGLADVGYLRSLMGVPARGW